MIPRILAIAGSDSGGGAGIQADLKTVTALGGFGMSAVTALTAQNTLGVRGIFPVTAQFVADQIGAVAEDIGVDAAKTGMLANAEVIGAVAECVARYELRPLVVDPVMVAKSGDALLEPDAVDMLREELLPLATVVTPNLSEAGRLTGLDVEGLADMREAARRLSAMGPKWVLVKGGHLAGEPTDLLFDGRGFREVTRPRVPTTDTHGTGCTYASAIATGLGFGMDVPEAVGWARDALQRALEAALPLGRGCGPVNHAAMFGLSRPGPDG